MKSKGVVIYSLKKPAYGKFAWNLAVSIKATSPNVPVCIIHDGQSLSHLEGWRLGFFDQLIQMDHDDIYHNGKFMPGKAKLSGYKYLPFDENIIIDADSICIEDVNKLFELCTKDVHAQAVGSWDETAESWTCQWMSMKNVKEVFKLPEAYTIYEINSSFMFIRKSEQAKALYEQALKNFETAHLHNKLQKWGGGFPDELGWNVAFAQLGIHPQFDHQKELSNDAQEPIFFSTRFQNDWSYVHSKYTFIGFFGDRNFTDSSLQGYYDRLMIGNGKKFGFRHDFKCAHLMKEKHVKEK